MNTLTLYSSRAIRDALGPDVLMLLEKLDPYARERARTSRAAKAGGLQWDTCWTCGRSTHLDHANIEHAHILSLEEGGSSDPNNLVPLCSRSRSLDADPLLLGCHQLFDIGALSRNEMMALIKRGEPDLTARKRMIETVQLARKNEYSVLWASV